MIIVIRTGQGGEERYELKAYLDNNIVSAIAKDDTPAESNAIDTLLEAYGQQKIQLVTSELTHEEIKKYQGTKCVKRTFLLLEKVPVVRWDELVGMNVYTDRHTCINSPVIMNDPLYDVLLKLGLKEIDRQHIFVAAKNGCDCVLTCDGGVLSRSEAVRARCAVSVLKPSELVAQQQWKASTKP